MPIRSAWYYHHEYRPPVCPECFTGEGDMLTRDDPDHEGGRGYVYYRCNDPECTAVWCEEDY